MLDTKPDAPAGITTELDSHHLMSSWLQLALDCCLLHGLLALSCSIPSMPAARSCPRCSLAATINHHQLPKRAGCCTRLIAPHPVPAAAGPTYCEALPGAQPPVLLHQPAAAQPHHLLPAASRHLLVALPRCHLRLRELHVLHQQRRHLSIALLQLRPQQVRLRAQQDQAGILAVIIT